jgi:putative tryptophan/tyrosine transport system substrate-binding protein
MKRREFITLLGGAAAWPLSARAQQGERMRRIGVLLYLAEDDSDSSARVAAFQRGLRELGWMEGSNVRIDYRWGGGDLDRVRRYAAELVGLAPDVILVSSGSALAALQNATRTVPIVFVNVSDPVGAGYVASLSQPGNNTTGFTLFEYSISGKWLELLKEIAPRMTRAAVIRNPSITSGTGQFGAIQAVAASLGVELTPIDVRDASGMEHGVAGFTRGSNGGLIVTASPSAVLHRELIIRLAARHRLPAIYPIRLFVANGGLISYGPDEIDQHRRAASYVDRILKGGKPADLPVQAPTKYELVINLKTAKTLGLEVPPTLHARADEVIE